MSQCATKKAEKKAAKAAKKSAKAAAVQAKKDAKLEKKAGKKSKGIVRNVLILGTVAAVGYVIYKKTQPQEDPWVTAAGEPVGQPVPAADFPGNDGQLPPLDLTDETKSDS